MLNLPHTQRHLFDLDDSVAYINCAYMSPQLESIKAIGEEMLEMKAQPWKVTIQDFYEPVKALKREFATLIGAKDYQSIAIVPSASYGVAAAVKNISIAEDQEILLIDEQFPSNYYAWERLSKSTGCSIRMVAPPDSAKRSEDWTAKIIENILQSTKVVTMGHVHWADGTLFDLVAIRKACDTVGALLIIDGTQSVGALPFDVNSIRPDMLVCGGYKWLLGPYSCGVAYFGPYFAEGIPLEENWINRHNSEDFAGLVNYEPRYQPGAGRYSMGEHSNFQLVPQLTEGIRQLNEWGPENIQAYCDQLTKPAIAALLDLGCRIDESAQRAYHLFGIRLPDKIGQKALKTAFQKDKVMVSQRGDAIRIGPHVYNTPQEMDRLVACFKKALK
ncbi:MAG: aminotransferase class V-fold PLP-dependent enzyme [Bacteroidota bacterium]